MRALIATDHCFLGHGGRVYNVHCFGSDFFGDYLSVFDQVEVVCRMRDVARLSERATLSSCAGLSFRRVTNLRGPMWALASWKLGRRQLLEGIQQADAIIARVPSDLGWQATRIAKRLNKPFLAEVIGDPEEALKSRGRGFLYRWAARQHARRLTTLVSEATAVGYVSNLLSKLYPAGATATAECISDIRLPNDVLAQPRRFPEPPRPLRIVLVAGLFPYKRQEDLLTACSRVIQSHVDLKLSLAGDGPDLQRLQQMAQKLGISRDVEFLGHLTERRAVFDLLDSCHLFVMPSATEGMPRAMLEAMSRGVAAIGSRAGGIPELVRPQDLFDIGDIEQMVDLMTRIARDPDRLTQMSTHGVDVATRYTLDHLSPRRVNLYRQLGDAVLQPVACL
jgi:glycosyltransferase involved in cell wall biosynthesis